VRRQVRLVYYQEIALGNARSAFPGNLVAAGHVDHVNEIVREGRLKVSVKLSPPLSMNSTSVSGNRASISSTKVKFMLGSSRTAYAGRRPSRPQDSVRIQDPCKCPFHVQGILDRDDVIRDDDDSALVRDESGHQGLDQSCFP